MNMQEPPTRTEFLDLIALIDDEHFTMTRLLLVFFAYDMYDDIYGEDDWWNDDWYDNDYYYYQLPQLYDFSYIGDKGVEHNGELWVIIGYNNYCSDCNWMYSQIEFYYNSSNPDGYLILYAINYDYSSSAAPFGFNWSEPFLAIYEGDQLVELIYNPYDIFNRLNEIAVGTYSPPAE
jgi:hypothetical protein